MIVMPDPADLCPPGIVGTTRFQHTRCRPSNEKVACPRFSVGLKTGASELRVCPPSQHRRGGAVESPESESLLVNFPCKSIYLFYNDLVRCEKLMVDRKPRS
jgi:hypothetical protein